MYRAKTPSTGAVAGTRARVEPEVRTLESAAAEALRRSGGALPVERLRAGLDESFPGGERLTRCLRGRGDLFLLVAHPREPWSDQDWSPCERAEYEAAQTAGDSVLLIDGSAAGPGARLPTVLRESLLTMWGEAPEDDDLRRELGRAVAPRPPG